jgi:glucosamine--fructose-6-phosphate aminotransferase (isomerizing)
MGCRNSCAGSSLLQVTRNMVYLENGDIAELGATQLRIANAAGEIVVRPVDLSELSAAAVELGEYQHYMQKEIFEQPKEDEKPKLRSISA